MSGRWHRRDDRGVSSLELAIIAPSLLLLIFFVIQGALYFYGRSVALQAAREGVSQLRLEQTQQDYTDAHSVIEATVATFASSVGSGSLEHPKVTSSYDDARGEVTVVVSGEAVSLTGFSFHITERATGRIERFQDTG